MPATTPGTRRRDHWLLAFILLFAFALRIATADYGLWLDEIASVTFAKMPLADLWGDFIRRENNPPLYYTLLHFWIIPFGTGDVAVKALSAAIGTAGIFFSYLCARVLTGQRQAGLYAAALLAVFVHHVEFSQDARGYILAFTGAMAALTALVRIEQWDWKSAPPPAREQAALFLLYVAGLTVALYSHTILAVLPALTGVQLGLFCLMDWPRRRPTFLRVALASLLVAMLWVWWGVIAFGQIGNTNIAWIRQPTPRQAFDAVLEMYAGVTLTPHGEATLAVCVLAVLAGIWSFRKSGAPALPWVLLATPVLLFAIGWRTPVLMGRTLFWASGIVFVLVAAGLSTGRWRRISLLTFLLLLTNFALQTYRWLPQRQTEDWNGVTRQLLRQDPAMPVVVSREDIGLALLHYCAQQRPGPCPLSITILNPPDPLAWSRGLSGLVIDDAASLRQKLRAAPRFALVGWGASEVPDDITARVPTRNLTFGRAHLRLYGG